LRRVLERRVERAARHHPTDRDEAARHIEAILMKFERSGLIDDQAYAESRARSLFRGGASQRKIKAQLAHKGVQRAEIDGSIANLEEEEGAAIDLDLKAAIRYAKRRRLGPFRAAELRQVRRDRDLAAMARTGFSGTIARTVIDATSVEELEGLLTQPD
jgi:regulatory protein